MKSEEIKQLVLDIKDFIAIEDKDQNILNRLVSKLLRTMRQSPRLAASFIDYLSLKNIDVFTVETDESIELKKLFDLQMENLGERDVAQIRQITCRMF